MEKNKICLKKETCYKLERVKEILKEDVGVRSNLDTYDKVVKVLIDYYLMNEGIVIWKMKQKE